MTHLFWWERWRFCIEKAKQEQDPRDRDYHCRAAAIAQMEFVCRMALYFVGVKPV